jgi:hypothetical protein
MMEFDILREERIHFPLIYSSQFGRRGENVRRHWWFVSLDCVDPNLLFWGTGSCQIGEIDLRSA